MANIRIALVSPVASGGVAHFLDTAVAYSAGTLLSLRNNGVQKFSVDYAGVATATKFAGPLNGTVGATTPASGAFTTVTTSGIVSVDDVTDTTSTVTGSIHTDGGVGIAKALWVGTTSRLVGAVTMDGALKVTSAGPHAIGGAADGRRQLTFAGTYTSDGSSNNAGAVAINTSIVGHSGDTVGMSAFSLYPVLTNMVTTTVTNMATVSINEPNIVNTGGGTITNATTLHIVNAPTEGTNNRAFWVETGASAFGGAVTMDSTLTVTGLVSIGGSTPASAGATGTAGTVTWDASYIYVCSATNTWLRAAIATWP